MLNSEQATAVREVLRAYDSGAVFATLSGAPGTGKTYTVGHIVAELKAKGLRHIAVAASTNKAVDVVRQAAQRDRWYHQVAWWGTVHSLLGLVLDVDEGRLLRLGRDRAGEFDVVIVDEASMLASDVLALLRGSVRFALLVGARNQLPPVGEDLPAAFIVPGPELKTAVRHQHSEQLAALISYVARAIDNQLDELPHKLTAPFVVPDLETWQAGIGVSKDEVALAYTNAEVERLNRIVRGRLGHRNEYDYGDRLVFTKPLYRRLGVYQELVFATSQVVTVTSAARCYLGEWPCWNLRVKSTTDERYIIVLNTEGANNLEIQELEAAHTPHPAGLASVKYGYGLTVHRSQGSEWDTVHVNYQDIRRCMDVTERRKLAYVAFSRAKSCLRILL